MARIVLLTLALLTALWTADQIDGRNVLDPDGAVVNGDGRVGRWSLCRPCRSSS